MKKIMLALGFLSFMTLSAQKNNKNILQSTNIREIESFLRTAHPEDPRRTVLKPKLIALKNTEWTKGKATAKPTEARPVVAEIPKSVVDNPHSSEAKEFTQLMTQSSAAHKEKTVKLLNTLFDQDINRKEAILLIQNNSDCNMILRIQGRNFYNLAVPAHGESSVVINKGGYQLTSNLCDAKYNSSKSIMKNTLVILNNPVINMQQNRSFAKSSDPVKKQ